MISSHLSLSCLYTAQDFPRFRHTSIRLKRINILILLSCVLFYTSSFALASSFTITGEIKDQSGQVISGATVWIFGSNKFAKKVKSDQRGVYTLKVSKSGRYTLVVRTKGYQKLTKKIKVTSASQRYDLTILKTSKAHKKKRKKRKKKKNIRSSSYGYGGLALSGMGMGGGGGRGVLGRGRRVVGASRGVGRRIGRVSRGMGRVNSRAPRESKLRQRRKVRSLMMSNKNMLNSSSALALLKTGQPRYNRDEYQHHTENGFKDVMSDPLSTLSIDVDTASYSNVRRYLSEDQRPPKGAIRVEEMINYFTYTYEAPQKDDQHPFKIYTEIAPAPWSPQHQLLHIGLQGRRIKRSHLPPSNLVFLIDVSGSMQSTDKLPLLKHAFSLLVNTLRPQDTVSIVVYAGSAGVVLSPTSGDEKRQILNAINQLNAGGSTAGGEGINLAYRLAQESFIKTGNNRVILATDGDFNVGVSSQSELVTLIEKKRKTGVFLTVLGFGRGNYQDARMSTLAQKGNGNHAYIDNLLEAQKVLVSEMGGTLLTIAKDVKIQVEFNPKKVKEYRLIGYESRILSSKDFNDDKKDAGELGAGHSVTALYELIPAGQETGTPSVDELKYQQRQQLDSEDWISVKFRYKRPKGERSVRFTKTHQEVLHAWEDASEDFRFSAGVAAFGMHLSKSPHRGDSTWSLIKTLVSGSLGEDTQGYRAELLSLIQKASDKVSDSRN